MSTCITVYNGSLQELSQAQETIRRASGAEATDCSQAIWENSPQLEEFLDEAAVVGDSEKALDTATGGDEHQSLALSNDWKLAEVLPFCMLLEEQEVVHSVSATVVQLCPLVAVLVSRVRGLPVKLAVLPDDCTALQWPLLKSQPDVRAPNVDANTQIIFTGPIISGLHFGCCCCFASVQK